MRLYNLAFNLVVLSTFFLVWQIREEKNFKFKQWLTNIGDVDYFEFFNSLGIWSVEHMATASIFILPNEYLKKNEFVNIFRSLKDKASKEIMLPLWLKDKDLEPFVKLNDVVQLSDLGYKYPGEIFEEIGELDQLDSAERHYTRTNVHRFKQAVREFISGAQGGAFVRAKKLIYEKQISSWSWYFSPTRMFNYLQRNQMALVYMAIFAVFSHAVIMKAVPSKNLGTSNILYLLILFWINPIWGRFNIYLMLVNRLVLQPVRVSLLTAALHAWLLTGAEFHDKYHVLLFSVLPTIAFLLCIHAMSFQPMVIRNDENKNIDMTITGIGSIDERIQTFIRDKKVSMLYKIIIGLKIENNFDWADISRIRVEEVDFSWKYLKQLFLPSLESGKLKVLWIINNREFTDNEAEQLAQLLSENKSIENIRVAFDYEYSYLEKIYHLLLWENADIKFTSQGAHAILKAIHGNENSKIEMIDFFGVKLSEDLLKLAKDLHTQRHVKVMGSKAGTIKEGLFSNTYVKMLLHFMCRLGVVAFCMFQLYQVIWMGCKDGFQNRWSYEVISE